MKLQEHADDEPLVANTAQTTSRKNPSSEKLNVCILININQSQNYTVIINRM